VLCLATIVLCTHRAHADNPIIQTLYAADPAPMVHGDTVYLCTSHDEDVTVDNFFTMNDWRVFSSKDIVNWTDHGSPLSYESFSWSDGKAWAPHCVERDGMFYFYVPVSPNAIGVAVADSPLGPFTDPIGEPLVTGSHQYIDPTVFVDEDGQAYLYFGNPKLWYVRLNDDMISYEGSIQEVPNTTQSFGQRDGDAERPTLYEEGPWFYRRNDLYYMLFAASGIPEDIAYSTSPGPTGPWTYGDIIMENASGHAFTNHAGVVDFKGHSYFFYHTQELPGGGGFKRSVAVEEFSYEADGSFPSIPKTSNGPAAAESLNPFFRTEGETIAWTGGVEVEDCEAGGRNVSSAEAGDYIKVKSVDFLTGALSFTASVASGGPGGSLELRLDAQDGELMGTCSVEPTGGWQTWASVSCDVSEEATGVHDLFLVFAGGSGSLFNLDYWQFTPKDPLPTGTGGAAGTGGGSTGGTGGTSSSGGTLGSGGAVTASGGTTPAASGGAGTSSGGAVAGVGGSGGSSGPIPPPADCSCRTGPGRDGAPGAWLLAALVFVGAAVRRRRAVA
jgi:arabinoxylan arabinofuranohydrolase